MAFEREDTGLRGYRPNISGRKTKGLADKSAEYLRAALSKSISDWDIEEGIGDLYSNTYDGSGNRYYGYAEYVKSVGGYWNRHDGHFFDNKEVRHIIPETLKNLYESEGDYSKAVREQTDSMLGRLSRYYCGMNLRMSSRHNGYTFDGDSPYRMRITDDIVKWVGLSPYTSFQDMDSYSNTHGSVGNFGGGPSIFWTVSHSDRFNTEIYQPAGVFTSGDARKSLGLSGKLTFEEENEAIRRLDSNPMWNYIKFMNEKFNKAFSYGEDEVCREPGGRRYSVSVTDEMPEEPTYNGFETSSLVYGEGGYSRGKTYKSRLLQRIDSEFSGYATTIEAFYQRTDDSKGNKHTMSNVTKEYGVSHGRNLLSKGESISVGAFDNPYCRVWTRSHRYGEDNGTLIRHSNPTSFSGVFEGYGIRNGNDYGESDGSTKWHERYKENGTIAENGYVRITPSASKSSGKYNGDVRKCMFSIENLAWKGRTDGLSEEQKGPNGGRIMWFPPYNLSFSENANVNWNEYKFIGRGEGLYSYNNTSRGGTLGFCVLVDHPSIVDIWDRKESRSDSDNQNTKDYGLLRFFAGCGIDGVEDQYREDIDKGQMVAAVKTDTSVTNDSSQDAPNLNAVKNGDNAASGKQNEVQSPEGAEGANSDSEADFVTNVYFPNNYSGIGEESLNDFCKYMLFGIGGFCNENGTYYTGNVTGYGYEMGNGGQGLTDGDRNGEYISVNGEKIYRMSSGGAYSEYGYRTDTFKPGRQLRVAGNSGDTNDNGLNIDKTNENCPSGKDLLMCLSDEGAEKLRTFISNNGISKIEVAGCATDTNISDGVDDKLSRDRRDIVAEILSAAITGFSDLGITKGDSKVVKVSEDENSFDNKRARKAIVRFYKKKTENSDTNGKKASPSESNDKNNQNPVISSESNGKDRYDDEYRFFREIESRSPNYYNKILENVSYFNPAFHSITPEGFNARLTFLQQCTRQGPTDAPENATFKGHMASNLAFGRPPICVLRIGDFYNTKIKIDSVSVKFGESVQYDLNPEGIGLQPMMANIDITFTFLGGSDLGGPISRLQNAVSFNYYANASIYDDRADIVKGDKFLKGRDPNKS